MEIKKRGINTVKEETMGVAHSRDLLETDGVGERRMTTGHIRPVSAGDRERERERRERESSSQLNF